MNSNIALREIPPPPGFQPLYAKPTSQWFIPNQNLLRVPVIESYRSKELLGKEPPPVIRQGTMSDAKDVKNQPIWERRGANRIKPLRLHRFIRGDVNWADKASGADELLQIVYDNEWKTFQPNYYEVHSLADIDEGVIIDPPTYPAWYTSPSNGSIIRALLPDEHNSLLCNALAEGYSVQTLVHSLGSVVISYSLALIHRKKRAVEQVLILARQGTWQGAAAIVAGIGLLRNSIRVVVYLAEPSDGSGYRMSKEIYDFIAAGGKVYTKLEGLTGAVFRVVVVALQDQYSGRKSDLCLYGEWLQHSVAIFVDPPVLKCTYTTALQIATQGCYNMCQKTILLVPFMPKPYIIDNFVDLVVVDCGIKDHTQRAMGITHPMFPTTNCSKLEHVIPVEFTIKGNRVYFYKNGKILPY